MREDVEEHWTVTLRRTREEARARGDVGAELEALEVAVGAAALEAFAVGVDVGRGRGLEGPPRPPTRAELGARPQSS